MDVEKRGPWTCLLPTPTPGGLWGHLPGGGPGLLPARWPPLAPLGAAGTRHASPSLSPRVSLPRGLLSPSLPQTGVISLYDCVFKRDPGYNQKLHRDDREHAKSLGLHVNEEVLSAAGVSRASVGPPRVRVRVILCHCVSVTLPAVALPPETVTRRGG